MTKAFSNFRRERETPASILLRFQTDINLGIASEEFQFQIEMYSTKYSILFICVFVSLGKIIVLVILEHVYLILVLLWCTNAESSEQQDQLLGTSDEEYDDLVGLYRRASLRPVVVRQRASLRPVGKRASLRPFGKRASLRPVGKRASLRPPVYFIN